MFQVRVNGAVDYEKASLSEARFLYRMCLNRLNAEDMLVELIAHPQCPFSGHREPKVVQSKLVKPTLYYTWTTIRR